MSSIIVPGTFTDTSLPVDTDLKTTLAANAGLVMWAQADAEHVTTATGISAFTNVKPGSPLTFAQATAGRQATLTGNVINGYSAATFDGTDDFYAYSGALPFSADFSLVVLFSAAPDGNDKGRGVFMSYTGSASQTGFYVNGVGNLRAYHLAGVVEFTPAITRGVPHLAIMGVTGSTLRGALDGGAVQSTTVSGTTPTMTLALGTLNNNSPQSNAHKGWISDAQIWNIDLLHPDNAATLAEVYDYFSEVYGLTLGA